MSLLPLMVSLSNHDSGNGGILRQAQDERKPKKPITLHKPCLACGQVLGVVNVGGSFPDAAFSLAVAVAGIETHAVQVVYAAVITALERFSLRRDAAQVVQEIGGGCGRGWFLTGMGENQRVGGALGGAPGFLGCVPKIAGFKALDGLRLDLSGVGEKLGNAVSNKSCGVL
ncbi:MAG: hypothetical protein OXF79_18305 [Chloroflexi bacterium]|nr:hypothetical protein [Chloroflexota bacterium]